MGNIERQETTGLSPGEPNDITKVTGELDHIRVDGVNDNFDRKGAVTYTGGATSISDNAINVATNVLAIANNTARLLTLTTDRTAAENSDATINISNTIETLTILTGSSMQTINMPDPGAITDIYDGRRWIFICNNIEGARASSTVTTHMNVVPPFYDGTRYLTPVRYTQSIEIVAVQDGDSAYKWSVNLGAVAEKEVEQTSSGSYEPKLNDHIISFNYITGTQAISLPAITSAWLGRSFIVNSNMECAFSVTGFDRINKLRLLSSYTSPGGHVVVTATLADAGGGGFVWEVSSQERTVRTLLAYTATGAQTDELDSQSLLPDAISQVSMSTVSSASTHSLVLFDLDLVGSGDLYVILGHPTNNGKYEVKNHASQSSTVVFPAAILTGGEYTRMHLRGDPDNSEWIILSQSTI